MAVDWAQIEADYLSSDTSYAKLAKKYGVTVSAVKNHGWQNHWKDKRNHIARAQEEVMVTVLEEKKDRMTKYLDLTDKLADKLSDAINAVDPRDTMSLRAIAGAVRDLRVAQGLTRTQLDIEEQQARIEAYRAKAALVAVDNSEDNGILVQFETEGVDV